MLFQAQKPGKAPWTFRANSKAEAIAMCVGCSSVSEVGGAAPASFQMVGGNQASISLGGIVKGIGKVATGLIPGTLDDQIYDALTKRSAPPAQIPQTVTPRFAPTGSGPCQAGAVLVAGRCVDPSAALPGGDPFVSRPTTGGGAEGISPWGLYTSPSVEMIARRNCPKGLVLGKDGNCYAHLRNSDRMHPKPPKPAITGGDMKAIRRADRVTKRIQGINKKLGLRVPTKRKK